MHFDQRSSESNDKCKPDVSQCMRRSEKDGWLKYLSLRLETTSEKNNILKVYFDYNCSPLATILRIVVSCHSTASLIIICRVVVVVVTHLDDSIGLSVVVGVRVVDIRLYQVPCLVSLAKDDEGDATCDDEQDSKCSASCDGQSCLLVALICKTII